MILGEDFAGGQPGHEARSRQSKTWMKKVLENLGIAKSIGAVEEALRTGKIGLATFRAILIVAPMVGVAAFNRIAVARGRIPSWPENATQMDDFLGFEGQRVSDLPSTPG